MLNRRPQITTTIITKAISKSSMNCSRIEAGDYGPHSHAQRSLATRRVNSALCQNQSVNPTSLLRGTWFLQMVTFSVRQHSVSYAGTCFRVTTQTYRTTLWRISCNKYSRNASAFRSVMIARACASILGPLVRCAGSGREIGDDVATMVISSESRPLHGSAGSRLVLPWVPTHDVAFSSSGTDKFHSAERH
jgi:hypothetical protein